jgi:hypothetical protein
MVSDPLPENEMPSMVLPAYDTLPMVPVVTCIIGVARFAPGVVARTDALTGANAALKVPSAVVGVAVGLLPKATDEFRVTPSVVWVAETRGPPKSPSNPMDNVTGP